MAFFIFAFVYGPKSTPWSSSDFPKWLHGPLFATRTNFVQIRFTSCFSAAFLAQKTLSLRTIFPTPEKVATKCCAMVASSGKFRFEALMVIFVT
jgi:hypothetical protein